MRRSKYGSALFLFGNGPRNRSRPTLETACRLIGRWRRWFHSEVRERVIKQPDKFLESRVGHRDPDDLDVLDGALAKLSRWGSEGQQDDSRSLANMGAGDEDGRIYSHCGTKYGGFYRVAITICPLACSAPNPTPSSTAKRLLHRGFSRNNSYALTLKPLAVPTRMPGSIMDSRSAFSSVRRQRSLGKESERSVAERVSGR
jgi:hypothetical protein